jgi:NADPH:quinone reductase-like Zn-dependent oxidoreductase
MRAVAVSKAGDPAELMELPIPRPGPGEVLVELAAASLNPIDVGIAQGYFEDRMPHVYPIVLGVDGAGRVAEVGEGVRGLRVGDSVHGQFLCTPIGHGTFADYALVPEFPDSGALQRTPDGMPAGIAAALPTAGMTAVGVLEAIGLRAGQSILIVGAAGGVGVFAVQLAAARGAQVVATARPDADRWIRQLGAIQTVDYTSGDVAGQVRRAFPGGVDAVLDLTRDPDGFSQYAGLVRIPDHPLPVILEVHGSGLDAVSQLVISGVARRRSRILITIASSGTATTPTPRGSPSTSSESRRRHKRSVRRRGNCADRKLVVGDGGSTAQ